MFTKYNNDDITFDYVSFVFVNPCCFFTCVLRSFYTGVTQIIKPINTM